MTLDSDAADEAVLKGAAVLRDLTASDASDAAALIRLAFAAQPRATRPPSSALRETAELVAAKFDAGGGIGAEAGGKLIAVVLWQVAGDALHVARFSVLPEWRGRGLSRALMAACEQRAKARRLRRLTLKVRLELPENERLFERYGFRRHHVEAHEGFEQPTTAVMERVLG
jgi:GNAT superfamily N-acetyltransferase